jgi:hypothetical protein
LAEAYLHGRDKLTLVADRELEPFGAWLEQLIAESSGKQGKGIIPINGEPVAKPDAYGEDRLFYYIRRDGTYDGKLKKLLKAGHPVITQDLEDNTSIASEFYKWEIAIAVACSIMGVNAFDQPDVQDSKNRTEAKISYYQSHHKFKQTKPIIEEKGLLLFGNASPDGKRITKFVTKFLTSGNPGDYIAINAYLTPEQDIEDSLQKLRAWIREKTKLATTVSFGPRYLHSTGQLHKGGANKGLFLILTADHKNDVEIPDEKLTFGALENGQALGDFEALAARERRVIRLHLANPEMLTSIVDKLTNG